MQSVYSIISLEFEFSCFSTKQSGDQNELTEHSRIGLQFLNPEVTVAMAMNAQRFKVLAIAFWTILNDERFAIDFHDAGWILHRAVDAVAVVQIESTIGHIHFQGIWCFNVRLDSR